MHGCLDRRKGALRLAEACGVRVYQQCLGLHPNGYTALVMARHGLFVVNVNDMYIGASLMMYGEWSEEELRVMQLNLEANSSIVDVGANIGTIHLHSTHTSL